MRLFQAWQQPTTYGTILTAVRLPASRKIARRDSTGFCWRARSTMVAAGRDASRIGGVGLQSLRPACDQRSADRMGWSMGSHGRTDLDELQRHGTAAHQEHVEAGPVPGRRDRCAPKHRTWRAGSRRRHLGRVPRSGPVEGARLRQFFWPARFILRTTSSVDAFKKTSPPNWRSSGRVFFKGLEIELVVAR